jgi:hypothetical protein
MQKMKQVVAVLVIGLVLVVLGGSALGQEWTPDKDQVVEQPKPHFPMWINISPSGCFSAIPTITPRIPWTAAWSETGSA